MEKNKNHCRCTECGFIRYNSQSMSTCPMCGNRNEETIIPSFSNKKEALALFCEAFKITPTSTDGVRIKQALDIIMYNV